MNRKIHFVAVFAFIFCLNNLAAQERVDTIYYDKDWKGVGKRQFADFYRIAIYPENSHYKKQFRDYFITGELQGSGGFISIDKFDDSKSIFDGECVGYFKNGKIEHKDTYRNGKLNGESYKYTEDGLIAIKANLVNGELDGLYTEFLGGGDYIQAEYRAGEPKHNYYIMSNADGQVLKLRISDNEPIWESPSVAERKTEYQKGIPWQFYTKNGLMVALTNTTTKDYGKWHRADIIISNNSLVPIEFDPEKITAYSIDKKEKTTNLPVWSCNRYMRKVRNAQAWAAVAVGVSEGLATANAGCSTSTTNSSTYSSGQRKSYGSASAYGGGGYAYGTYSGSSSYSGSSYTTSTTTNYDAAAAYQARVLSANRIADFENAQWDARQIRQEGYLKKSTIYPGETISGYVHIERISGNSVYITIKINGANYIYGWRYGK